MLFDRARSFMLKYETFPEQLIEGLVYPVDHGRKDPIVRILVSPEHMELATPIVGGSNLATRLTAEMWDPIFHRAMERGELRADLDLTEVAEWLALIQFILVGRLDFSRPDDPGHRKLLKTFVLPAFLPVGVTEAGVQVPAITIRVAATISGKATPPGGCTPVISALDLQTATCTSPGATRTRSSPAATTSLRARSSRSSLLSKVWPALSWLVCRIPFWGQRVVAGYTSIADAVITDEQILDQCRQRLTDFKRPKPVYRMAMLPLTVLGKIDQTEAAALRAASTKSSSSTTFSQICPPAINPKDQM